MWRARRASPRARRVPHPRCRGGSSMIFRQITHEAFDDGWQLEMGSVLVRALHTPGHRPEHTAFALIDSTRGPEPWALLSGDTLFVGDVARPDLAIDKSEGARGIFQSLHDQILS